MNELLRYVDTIHRDRRIDKEIIFLGLEMALISAAQKKLGTTEGIEVTIDRTTGEVTACYEGETLSPEDLGRIAALSGKQVLLQKIREAEREVTYEEYLPKVGNILTGTVQSKKPGGVLIISLGKAEGILPRSEQSPAETFNEGDRIKVVLAEVNKQPSRVQLLCSRASPELVRKLFELEIPEVSDYVVEIKAIAREAGHRTKIAVTTYDPNVDCVGACVGVKGARIRNIVDELFGEKIDIVRWNDSIEVLIVEALKPAEIASLELDFETKTATVFVKPDQQSLAIGRRGQNVRLASKLSGWDLNITPISEEDLDRMKAEGMENLASELFQDKIAQIEGQQQEASGVDTPRPSRLDKLFSAASESDEGSGDEGVAAVGVDRLTAAFAAEATRGTESEEGAEAAGDVAVPVAGETEVEAAPDPEAAEEKTTEKKREESREFRLEDLPGVGKVTAERLRTAGLDTLERIRELGEESLASVDGVGERTARQIMEFLELHS